MYRSRIRGDSETEDSVSLLLTKSGHIGASGWCCWPGTSLARSRSSVDERRGSTGSSGCRRHRLLPRCAATGQRWWRTTTQQHPHNDDDDDDVVTTTTYRNVCGRVYRPELDMGHLFETQPNQPPNYEPNPKCLCFNRTPRLTTIFDNIFDNRTPRTGIQHLQRERTCVGCSI